MFFKSTFLCRSLLSFFPPTVKGDPIGLSVLPATPSVFPVIKGLLQIRSSGFGFDNFKFGRLLKNFND